MSQDITRRSMLVAASGLAGGLLVPRAFGGFRTRVFADRYKVNLNISDDDVRQLKEDGFFLFGFKAVQSSSTGLPSLWFATDNYNAATTISWEVQYEAFATNGPKVKNGVTIDSWDGHEIDLGQTLLVDKDIVGTVESKGPENLISISTEESAPAVRCGIAQKADINSESLDFNPIALFDLPGRGGVDTFLPKEKIFLIFATGQRETATLFEQSFGPGSLIDLTGAPGLTRTVSYSFNDGWESNPPNQTWAKSYSAQQDLAPVLITSA